MALGSVDGTGLNKNPAIADGAKALDLNQQSVTYQAAPS